MVQARFYANTAVPTTLTANIGPANVVINVASSTGYPATPFGAALDYGTPSEEVVLVTAVAGTVWTVTRAYDGTSATSHNVGAPVRHTWIAADGNEARAHEGTGTNVHGISALSNVVGTTDIQTLTNKTLTAPTITSPAVTGNVTGTPNFSSGFTAGGAGQLVVSATGGFTTTGIGGFQSKLRTVDSAPVTGSTVLVNDSVLFVPVEANAAYELDCWIKFTAVAGEDIKIAWTFPAGSTMEYAALGTGPTNFTDYDCSIVPGGTSRTTRGNGATPQSINSRGYIMTTGTAGNLQLQFAQGTSGAGNTTILTGSWIRIRRVS